MDVGESGNVAIEDRLARLDCACWSRRLCDDLVGFSAEVCEACNADGGRCPCGNGTLEGPAPAPAPEPGMGMLSDVL